MEKNNLLPSKKLSKSDSPKTPGGISKSLLTPCRRLGLSRKWKRGGSSPFVSPLTTTNTEAENGNELQKKRKFSTNEMHEIETKVKEYRDPEICALSFNTFNTDIKTIPTRILSPRKKCKNLLLTKQSSEEYENIPQFTTEVSKEISLTSKVEDMHREPIKIDSKVSKLSRKKSRNSFIQSNTNDKPSSSIHKITVESSKNTKECYNQDKQGDVATYKDMNSHNLTKECIVVIQNKMFKSDLSKNKLNKINKLDNDLDVSSSQCLVESDSDDIPLSSLNKNTIRENNYISISHETCNVTDMENEKDVLNINDDFIENNKINVKKLEHKTTSTSGLKIKVNNSTKKHVKGITVKCQTKSSSQSSNSYDDDDDFDFEKRKTILIKKTYDKVTKPLKVRSTGSISQKDIDEITARIERKKNLLLAKTMTDDTIELRELIKKWQLGCQNALAELLELMKKKMPEQNMDYSEILRVLKIPPDLIGYDSENDCFSTPDDKSIILSGLKLN